MKVLDIFFDIYFYQVLCCNILIFCYFDKILLIYDSEKDVCVLPHRGGILFLGIVFFEGGCGVRYVNENPHTLRLFTTFCLNKGLCILDK